MQRGIAKKRATLPYVPHPRYGIILYRAARAAAVVREILEGPWTRIRFLDACENCVYDAAHELYGYLFAQANGEYADAARFWEQLQGILEYELPLVLNHTTKGLKKGSTREKAARVALPLVRAQLARCRKLTRDQYVHRYRDGGGPRMRVRRSIRLKHPTAGVIKRQTEDLFRWVEEVIDSALSEYENHRLWARFKVRKAQGVGRTNRQR